MGDVEAAADRTAASGPVPATRTGSSRLVRLYGASPLHLVALLACFAVTFYTLTRLFGDPALRSIAIWFVGAAIGWDLVGGPLLAAVDAALRPLRRIGLLNPLRVPLLISALLLLVWAPVIFQRSEGIFGIKAGLDLDPYLARWLVLSAVLFAGSFAVWGAGRLRRRSRETTSE